VSRSSGELVTIDKPWERVGLPMEEVREMYVAFSPEVGVDS
jgi:hypothetical protein